MPRLREQISSGQIITSTIHTETTGVNPVNYDLTLNSDRVGVENCVKTIEQYLIIKGFIKADMIKPVGELI